MKSEDLAKIVCGEFDKLASKEEKDGYAGVIIIKNFIDEKGCELNYLSKTHKIPVDFFQRAQDRLDRSGIFMPYSWLYKEIGNMRKDINRHRDVMIDWCYIAAKSSGYAL